MTGNTNAERTVLTLGEAPMGRLVSFLRDQLGRFVIDRTGLLGHYDITLEFARSKTGGEMVNPESRYPSLVTALEEQLGLKLKLTKASIEVLVIDRAEKPSVN
jgi:uncharacterized protein (TIGR03435 family)